jgi:hypothetical protein
MSEITLMRKIVIWKLGGRPHSSRNGQRREEANHEINMDVSATRLLGAIISNMSSTKEPPYNTDPKVIIYL